MLSKDERVIFALTIVAIGVWIVMKKPVPTTATEKVAAFARGIARAEGFGTPGAIPTVRHNPGDIKVNGIIATFASDDEGWAALYRQLNLIVSGESHVYTLADTIGQMAFKWTGNDNPTAWASIVASEIGARIENTLRWVLL